MRPEVDRSLPPFPVTIRDHPNVSKLLSRALGAGWTAHQLRHRFASTAYAAERDLRAVQELLGHSKPETTARYTAIPEGAKRAAVLAAAS
jgi:site-specific recombinase XerD